MAQKRRQTATGMDSVFDFIFAESKKTPDKVKPVKITGLDATDPYVDVATAVLEQPLMYINNTTESAIKGATDIELNTFEIDPDGGKRAKVTFNIRNIPDVLNNDLKFVDNAFAKLEAARKSGRMTAFGTDVAAFTAAGMARELGLDAETSNVFLKVGKSAADKNAEYEMNVRSIHLATNSWDTGGYENISEADLKAMYGDSDGAKMYNDLQTINRKYQAEMSKPADARDFSQVFNEAGDRNMHLLFERANLAQKAAKARNDAATFSPDSLAAKELNRQAKGYDDAQKVLGVLHDSKKYEKDKDRTGTYERFLIQKEADLSNLQAELQRLSGATDQASRDRVEEIGVEIKGINTQVRNFKIQKAAYDLGSIETKLNSVKQLYEYTVGGQFVPALLNGDFFNASKNTAWGLQPRATDIDSGLKTKKLYYLDKNGQVVEREFSDFLAKKGNNALQTAYYEGMMDFYYKFTPAGIVENLTTGKGFARQGFKQQESLMAAFQSGVGASFTHPLDWKKLFGPGSETYINSLRGNPAYDVFIQFFDNNKTQFKRCGSLIVRADKFNVTARIKKWMVEHSLYKKTFGKLEGAIAKRIGDFLLKRIKDDAAKKIVEEWAKKATLEGASIAIKAAIKSFLAGASGGVSAALGFVVDKAVDIAMSLAIKAAKPIIKGTISAFVFGVVGLFGLIVLLIILVSSPFKTMKTLGQYSHVAPHEIVMGDPDYTVPQGSGGPGGGDIPPGGDFPVYSGNASAIFNAIAAEMGLSVSLVSCDTDPAPPLCANIGNAWCWAQGSVYCYMSRIPESAYNTIFRHELMHFAQTNYGPADRPMREWGADYMSNNGGYYCFLVNGTYMRATTTASVFMSEGGCSESDLVTLAYRRSGADPQCEAYVSSIITSYLLGGSCQ